MYITLCEIVVYNVCHSQNLVQLVGECEQYNLKHPVVSIKETPRRRITATSSLKEMKYPQLSSEKGESGSFTPSIPSRLLDRFFKDIY